jgi:hemerythrin-like domain-containing protein
MKPIGPLMREHRLIERMVNLLNSALMQIGEKNEVDVKLLPVAIDFFRSYADRIHHGKEENILFRELAKKKLSQMHGLVIDELVQEHIVGRKMVSTLDSAWRAYAGGNAGALNEIMTAIKELVGFYPAHIKKEDERFFYPAMEYLNKQEQAAMLEEFYEFDRKFIHDKYQGIVEELETTKA